MVCNAFRLHNVNELEERNGQNMLTFVMEGVPLRPARKP